VTMTPSPPSTGLLTLVERSHQVIVEHQHTGGAYPASPTFSAYAGYAWLRDGAFTAEGVSRYGDVGSADRFHDWVARVLAARREQVAALVDAHRRGEPPAVGSMLPTRFRLDGADGTDPWWDFQTDGFGTWLWALVEHARRHDLDLGRWRTGVEVCVDYLTAVWDLPCYDWWEEHAEQRHVSTLGAVFGGLSAVAGTDLVDRPRRDAAVDAAHRIRGLVLAEGVHDGSLTKWLGSTAVDASLASCIVPFGLVERTDPLAFGTLDRIGAELDAGGGVHRFAADVFYGGGQWPLLSALLGWNRAASGDAGAATAYLEWIAAQLTADGELPEQVGHHLLAPESEDEWVQRWGPVATPLLWSHGMALVLADELGLTSGRAGR